MGLQANSGPAARWGFPSGRRGPTIRAGFGEPGPASRAAGACERGSFQDWRGWLEQGIIDMAVVMNYTRDRTLSAQITRQSIAAEQGKSKVYIGLGAYLLLNDIQNLKDQVDSAKNAKANGIVFFSYDNMLKKPEIFKMVKELMKKKRKYDTKRDDSTVSFAKN